MTDTTKVVITKDWTKVSDGACEVQSVSDRYTFDKVYFNLIVSDTPPTPDSTAFMRIALYEHANFHRDTPVWLRLDKPKTSDQSETVVVIK